MLYVVALSLVWQLQNLSNFDWSTDICKWSIYLWFLSIYVKSGLAVESSSLEGRADLTYFLQLFWSTWLGILGRSSSNFVTSVTLTCIRSVFTIFFLPFEWIKTRFVYHSIICTSVRGYCQMVITHFIPNTQLPNIDIMLTWYSLFN